MKKVIRSSNLSLRFYLSDGWVKEELDSYCARGEVNCSHPNDEDPYLTLTIGSRFNCEKLIQSCSSVIRAYNDYPEQPELALLESHNGI